MLLLDARVVLLVIGVVPAGRGDGAADVVLLGEASGAATATPVVGRLLLALLVDVARFAVPPSPPQALRTFRARRGGVGEGLRCL